MGKDVIVACDMPDKGSVMAFLERFGDERPDGDRAVSVLFAA